MILNHRRTAAVMCAAAAALALPAATVAQAEQTARVGLLDGLVGTLTGEATGTTITDPLEVLAIATDLLAPGGTDTGSLDLAAVTDLVDGLLGAGLVADPALVGTVLDTLMASTTDPTQITGLVDQLLGGSVDAGLVAGLVDDLLGTMGAGPDQITSIVTAVVGDLLGAGLPTDAKALEDLTGLLGGGALPTGVLLEPVLGLLDTLVANSALPAELRDAVGALAASVRGTGTGEVSPDLLGQLTGLLGGLTGTATLTSPVKDALNSLLGLLGRPTATTPPAATPVPQAIPKVVPPGVTGPAIPRRFVVSTAMRARISKVQADKARKTLRVTLKCPTAATFGCLVQTRARRAGKNVGKLSTVILKPNQTKAVKLKLPASTTRSLKRSGGQVGARATTLLGQIKPTASRNATVRKAKR